MCTMYWALEWVRKTVSLSRPGLQWVTVQKGDQTINKSLQHNVGSVDMYMCVKCYKNTEEWAICHAGNLKKKKKSN